MTAFREVCERWDAIAGPADWKVFSDAFDRLIDGLSSEDQDVVGRLIDVLRSGSEREAAPSQRSFAKSQRRKIESA